MKIMAKWFLILNCEASELFVSSGQHNKTRNENNEQNSEKWKQNYIYFLVDGTCTVGISGKMKHLL